MQLYEKLMSAHANKAEGFFDNDQFAKALIQSTVSGDLEDEEEKSEE